MFQNKTVAVILAGGQGTRFWPVSRRERPKQFLDLSGSGQSLIQSTASRISGLVPAEDIFVVTNEEQKPVVAEHLPEAKLIVEPAPKNTTAAIGLAAINIAKSNPETVMIVLPADHHVSEPDVLLKTLSSAVDAARREKVLVTVGIKPTSANTAYGYINKGIDLGQGVARVKRFFEKPNQKRAEEYLAAGDFFWNSGMFIWRASVILESLKTFVPEIYDRLVLISTLSEDPKNTAQIAEIFAEIESISIDFSVLEHAKNVVMVQAEAFGWSDVGSWDSWGELFPADDERNVSVGDVLIVDSQDCIVRSEKRLLAVLGVKDLVIVDFENACLVCARDRVQDVKLVVEELKRRGRNDLI
jgi:mannose-1-phosphate guanylyltransferase